MKKSPIVNLPAARPLLYTVILCTLPHLVHISIVAAAICIVMWGYLLGMHRWPLPVPTLLVRTVLGTLLFLVAVTTNAGLSVEAFVALLTLMIALKLFELKSERDSIIAVILCYFLIVSGMFFSDSLLATLYIFCTVLFNTAILIHIQFPRLLLVPALKCSAFMALRAFPLMLLLFLLFPRVQGGMWGRPATMEAKTGFSSEIAFGSIAQLAQSGKVAFRVTFADGRIPAKERLYWRGIVFWECNGDSWKQGPRMWFSSMQGFAKGSGKVDYTVTLEPHNQNWLFALDLPIRLMTQLAWLNGDFAPYRMRPVTGRLSYSAQSYLEAGPRFEDKFAAAALQLPEDGNIRARRLAAQWRGESRNSEEIIAKALQFYRDNNFIYTLQPGQQGGQAPGNAIDTFLFSTRRGFCEHYAASFGYLMRAAGVPARLVGGYLGGEKNPLGDYLVVRQSDAHVWVEVLGANHCWQRVDPTAAVAPERARSGSAPVITAGSEERLLSLLGLHGIPGWFKEAAYFWDLLNSRWNQSVMEYSNGDQFRLFSWLGIDLQINKGRVQAFLVGAVLLAAGWFIAFIVVKGNPAVNDPVAASWHLFCQKLAKGGVRRPLSQGPVDFLDSIGSQRPDLYDQAVPIVEMYIRLRYREDRDTLLIERFRRTVEKLRVKPNRNGKI